MDSQSVEIGGRMCRLFVQEHPLALLVQVVSARQDGDTDREVQVLASSKLPFALATVPIADWEQELMPWPEPVVSRRPEVGSGAKATLHFVANQLLPSLLEDPRLSKHIPVVLGGYSLGGLFALWAACQTDRFHSIAAGSPSLWAGDWPQYAATHPILARHVYLSLGDREEHTKNKTMARSADRLRAEYARLQNQLGESGTTLVWEQGGHFNDPAGRMVRAFEWCLRTLVI